MDVEQALKMCEACGRDDHPLAYAARTLAAEVRRLAAELEREDRAHTQTCAERDAAEEALSQAFFLVTGRSPEWSNHFGHIEALAEIEDAQWLLREAARERNNLKAATARHVARSAENVAKIPPENRTILSASEAAARERGGK